MEGRDLNQQHTPESSTELPFVAPCRTLELAAPARWLKAGWADFRHAWRASLVYGLFMALITAAVCIAAWYYGSFGFALVIMGGFVFVAPLTCIGLYAISAQLERDEPVSLRRALRAGFKRYLGSQMFLAIVLLIIFLVWARAGAMVHVFFPAYDEVNPADLITFLTVGSVVGAIFVAITFSASAYSLPMIVHRKVDAMTAVVTSINAVLRNRLVMILWLTIAVGGLVIGLLTLCVGLVVILPVLGHAAWHAYLDTIDADAFPRHQVGVTAKPRLR